MLARALAVLLWMVPLEGSAHPAEGHVLESLEQAVEEEPKNIQLRQRRADLRVFEGDVEGAFEDLAVALVLAPENPSVLRQQALLMERTNHPGAEQALAAAAIEGRDPDIFFRLGRLREGKGDTSGACDAWGAGMERLGAGILQESADRLGCASVLVHAERESTVSHAPPSPLPAVLDRSPYLQNTRPTGSTIVWRTDVESTGEVRWGEAPGQFDHITPSEVPARQHEVSLTELAPDSRTWYAVFVNGQQVAGGEDYFIQTPPEAGVRDPLRIWVVGDSGVGGKRTEMVRDGMVTWAGTENQPHFALHLGDMAHMDGTDDEFTVKYYDIYASLLGRLTVWPAIGNHEGHSLSAATQTGPYFEGYVLPGDGSAGGIPSGTEAYKSFDLGNTHFVVLDTHDSSREPTGAQMTWLTADLAASEAEWTVASFHHAPYSKGHLDSDVIPKMTEAREWVLPILEEGGVDLVLAGHSHTFERSYLLDGGYETPATDAAILDPRSGWATKDEIYVKPAANAGRQGTLYVTAGHGGSEVSGVGGHPVHCYEETENGSLVLDVHENRMTLTNVRLDGSVTDKATLVKGDALVVTSPDGGEAWVSGESQTLHWATVGEVSSVNVEWSCNGGESWIPVATNVENTGSMEWTAPLTATNSALVRVQSSSDPSLGDQSNGRFSVGTDQTVRVVDFTSPWRILDDNSNPGHSWKELSFDDSSWKTAPELDGCRRGRALSPLMDSPGTYSSYLLRHRFSLSQVPDKATLEMFLEDGIVVWLNGTTVFAKGVDEGQGLRDWATVDDWDAFLKTKEVEADLLQPGENLLAVLVKQASPGSSLLSFRAALGVVLTSEAEPQACPSGSPEETGGETSVETAVDSGGGADTSGPSKDHQSCGCGGTTEFPGAWLIGVGAFAGMTRRRQSFSRR